MAFPSGEHSNFDTFLAVVPHSDEVVENLLYYLFLFEKISSRYEWCYLYQVKSYNQEVTSQDTHKR